MNKENVKNSATISRADEDRWIDIHDDELMIELGLRPKKGIPRDKSVWTKSHYERQALKSLRKLYKGHIHFNSVPKKTIPVRAKLVIYLKKNKKFPKTTYSMECWQHEIDSILSNYCYNNPKTGSSENLVSRYVYNNRSYMINERPFWPGK